MTEPKIEGVEIHHMVIIMAGQVDRDLVDLGGVFIKHNDLYKWSLDVVRSWTDYFPSESITIIKCELDQDAETFPPEEYEYSLTKENILEGVTADAYVGGEFENQVVGIFLKARLLEEDKTIYIKVSEEE